VEFDSEEALKSVVSLAFNGLLSYKGYRTTQEVDKG
jgi:hypothetical protein